MMYQDFVEKTKNLSYFKLQTIFSLSENRRTLRNQLVQWQHQGKVHKLKNGVYALNDDDRKAPLSRGMISNVLYAPSYVSLETALSFFGLIPERVAAVTAVTTRKTAVFRNDYGVFSYRSLKPDLFFGFESIREGREGEAPPVLMASPEKAVLDKVYFDPSFRADDGYFLENLRLQNFEGLRISRLRDGARRFGSGKIRKAAVLLEALIRRERA
jgi:predicted transcriptional regulator of viral defense system